MTDHNPPDHEPEIPSANGPDSPGVEAQIEASTAPRSWPRILGVLILLLGAAVTWAWLNPASIQHVLASLLPATADPPAVEALQARVAALEQHPATADTGALSARIDALEKRLSPGGPSRDSPDLAARAERLESRDTGGSGTAGGDLASVIARLDALERHAGTPGVEPGKIESLTSRVDALANRDPAGPLRARLDDIETRVAGAVSREAGVAGASDRAARLARLEAAGIALAAGSKIGIIQGAPPSLARYADVAPPTEAALRLAYPTVMRAALKVSVVDAKGNSFLDRVLARLRDYRLITVREGDHLVLGDPTVETLEHAHVLLNTGDLAGAAREVGTVSGPPAAVLAGWLADARALVAAREALGQALIALAGNG